MTHPVFEGARRPFLVGVCHLDPTPGSPGFKGDFDAVLDKVRGDARALVEGGIRHAILENFGDIPFYAEKVPAETLAALALAVQTVSEAAPELCLGVNVLRNDARAGLGLCATTQACFLRVNVHIGAAVTDQGLVTGRAAETLRERMRLAPGCAILADVHVKHATPMGQESLAQAAKETSLRGAADALIVSGTATGAAPQPSALAEVRAACPDAMLLIGSGFELKNASSLLEHADGAIVGTSIKAGGDVHAPIDPKRVRSLVEHVHSLVANKQD